MTMGYGQAAQGMMSSAGELFKGMGVKSGAKQGRRDIRGAREKLGAMSEKQRQRQLGIQQPFMIGGQQAFDELGDFRMRETGPQDIREFGGVDLTQDPGYDWRMKRGTEAVNQNFQNIGAGGSGAQQKALMEFGQGLGSEEFDKAYGRQFGEFQDLRNTELGQRNLEAGRMMNYDEMRMNQLGNVAGMGQRATDQYGNAVSGVDAAESNLYMGTVPDYSSYGAQKYAAMPMAAGNASIQMGKMFGSGGSGGQGGMDFSSMIGSK